MPRVGWGERGLERTEALVKALLNHQNFAQIDAHWEPEESGLHILRVSQATKKALAEIINGGHPIYSPDKLATQKRYVQESFKQLKLLGFCTDDRTVTRGLSAEHLKFSLQFSSRELESVIRELKAQWWAYENKTDQNKTDQNKTETVVPKPELVTETFNTEELHPQKTPPNHNLPPRNYATFMGRQQELSQLLGLLHSNSSVPRISVEGIGGVGKTSLVLEAAHRCLQLSHKGLCNLEQPTFDAFVFTSAQQECFTVRGRIPRLKQERTLAQILRTLSIVLHCPEILVQDFDQQIEQIQIHLSRRRTLLIVDNLETIENQQAIFSFLHSLPASVKVIITSREQIMTDVPIRLHPLPKCEGISLIEHHCQIKAVSLSSAQTEVLYQKTGSIPAAIEYALGQLACGYQFQEMLPRLVIPENDFCHFYFKSSVHPLRGQPIHQLLMAMAMFPKPVFKEAIVQTALCTGDMADAFAQLCQLSLINLQQERYHLLPLTREYLLAELHQHPKFERQARECWLSWYLSLARKHVPKYWTRWQDYRNLNLEWENFEAAIEWCIDQKRYEDFSQLWQLAKGYTYLYGYWHERLSYLSWWLQAAHHCQDQTTILQAMRDRGWTLVLMGNPQQYAEAESLFCQVWAARNQADQAFELEVAIEQAILFALQEKLNEAETWLQTAKDLLEHLTPLNSDDIDFSYHSIRVNYYEARIWYVREAYDQAKELYQTVQEQASIIEWQQMVVYSLNWLAEIAIEEENYDYAHALLSQGLSLAESVGDRRSIAFHKRSWARLKQLQGDRAEFKRWATAAEQDFLQLGMEIHQQEIRSWLENDLNG